MKRASQLMERYLNVVTDQNHPAWAWVHGAETCVIVTLIYWFWRG